MCVFVCFVGEMRGVLRVGRKDRETDGPGWDFIIPKPRRKKLVALRVKIVVILCVRCAQHV